MLLFCLDKENRKPKKCRWKYRFLLGTLPTRVPKGWTLSKAKAEIWLKVTEKYCFS